MTAKHEISVLELLFLFLSAGWFFSNLVEVNGISVEDLNYNYTKFKREASSDDECTLPAYPEHGEWNLINGAAKPGDKIPLNSLIKFECSRGYKLSSQGAYLVCDDNWSSTPTPECEELCPPLYSSDTFELKCNDKRGREIKCSEATDETLLEYTCARFYETPFGYKKSLLCKDGAWDPLKPVCQPVCGKLIGTKDAKPLIYGSKPNDKLEYPWVVAVYRKLNDSFENVCGGSILSLTVVLTAAHCVTNQYGDALPKENYRVGAGKLYNKYEAPQDTQAQYMELSKLIVNEGYKAASNRFSGDLAVLVTQGEFVLNEVVQPICFTNLKDIHLHARDIGEVSGWGLAEGGVASDVLRTLKIPYKYETTCAHELPREWADKYNMVDKICAGFYNQSTSVCAGDSGSGLAFQNSENNRYYLHGLVSLGPSLGNLCDIQQNALYTKVAFYYDYIIRLLTKYAPPVRDCVLPPHPKNGRWYIEKQDKKPGDVVTSNAVLKVECDEKFKLSSSVTTIECGLAYNMPSCQPFCSAPSLSKEITYHCTDSEESKVNCSHAGDGSRLHYSCSKGYEIPSNNTNVRTCIKGTWESPKPKCVKIDKKCGKGVISLGTEDPYDYQPWNVGFYTKKEHKYFCGGSLISDRVILTAAHCVQNNDKFKLTAGKSYMKYNEPKDEHAQYSDVSEVIIHPSYRGSYRRYLADIAIVVAKKPFTFNSFVQPICLEEPDADVHKGDLSSWGVRFPNGLNSSIIRIVYYSEYGEEDADILFSRKLGNELTLADKSCGYFYRERYMSCRAMSGAGAFFRDGTEDRYYVYGIVTKTPEALSGDCIDFIAFTNTAKYFDFINSTLYQYK